MVAIRLQSVPFGRVRFELATMMTGTTARTPTVSGARKAVPHARKAAPVKQALMAVTASVVLAASPAMAADLELGESVFDGNCATCHSGGGNILIVRLSALQKI